MKKTTALLIAVFVAGVFACSGIKKVTPSTIGFTPLNNYLLNPGVSFTDAKNYLFIANAGDFEKTFYMTKSSLGNTRVPNFAAQSVVAIILKPTEKVVSVDINKAEISGENLNIYYSIIDTTSWKSYSQVPMLVATVPKSNSVRVVNFYSAGIKEKTITANY